MKLLQLFILSFLISSVDSIAQSAKDSVMMAGSTKFKINGGKKFWMGSNYRREWRTPIRVPVLNLTTEKGGLTPVKQGGGKQTRSLRVADASGKEYNLRSIEKFITSKSLPADLQSEAAEDLMADGISASYPYAALSVPVLAEAAGIPYLKLKVVYIPDDPKLGEYREDFRNLLVYMEEKLPEGVDKGYDTEEVVEELKKDNDNTVDQRALLKARILDMFVMDFDRHEGQWEWAAVDKKKGKQYYPIPKDRDQAFYINQGVLPHIVQWPWLVPQLEGFKAKAKNIKRFNFAARNLDRFFLNQLQEQDWINTTADFLSKMTDAVIDKALAQQPPEIRGLSTARIAATLKQRRDNLAGDVMEYYRFLSEYVNITASDKPELFDITRNEDGSVRLRVVKITDKADSFMIIYDRHFNPEHTQELRLYGFGGDDKFIVRGNKDKIKVRIIGGEGSDSFETPDSGEGTIVYDGREGDNKITGGLKSKMANDTIVNSFERLYYRYNQVIPFVSVGYNPDDGVYLGGWMKITHHGFRKDPYKNSHTITLNHALATRAFNFRYNAEFIGVFGRRSDLLFEADIKSPHITNFFGYGENSVYDKNQPGRFRFYRARYSLGDFSLELRKNFSEKVIMTLGPAFQIFKLNPDERHNKSRYIVQWSSHGLDPATLFARQSYFGGRFSLSADTRDNKILPGKGINWFTVVRHLSGLNDASYKVTQLNSDLTFHLTLIKKTVVIANRIGGGHNFGDFEFYQAQYLGNEDHLRGFRKNRFAGRSKLYNNLEMRIRLANFKTYLFPGSLGILGFYDTGKIWSDDDPGNKWLSGYGGGFWISPVRRMVFTFTYTTSKEDRIPLMGINWQF